MTKMLADSRSRPGTWKAMEAGPQMGWSRREGVEDSTALKRGGFGLGRYTLVAKIFYEILADPQPDLAPLNSAVLNSVGAEVDGEDGWRCVSLTRS